jgi:hypothetical protein
MFRAKELATAATVATLYVALVLALGPLSFLQVQVRVANGLIGLVPVVGMPAVYGLTLGVFLGNISSPLGPIDYISFVPSFIGLLAVFKLRNKSVMLGLGIYSLLLTIWVTYMLYVVFNYPPVITLAYVGIGMVVSTVLLGYLVYVGVKRAIGS